MKVFCAGFNLYGQFRDIDKTCIETFQTLNYLDANDIQISHTYLLLKIRQKIYLHGFLDNKSHQIKELKFDNNDEIIQISASDSNSLLLTKQDKVWSMSPNVNKLGYDLTQLCDFHKVGQSGEKEDQVLQVCRGYIQTIACTKLGYVFNIPSKLDFKGVNVKQTSCGREHCLILSEEGFVYSFGGGSRGQLGHGDVEDQEEPKLIESLCGIKIIKIACGGWHSVALSIEGDLYTWGWNSNGQLDLKTNKKNDHISVMATPQVIQLDENIIDVECGSRHTIILLENNKLYGFGWNKYCQLGVKTVDENCYEALFLSDFSDMKVAGLRCGPWNSAVLVNEQ